VCNCLINAEGLLYHLQLCLQNLCTLQIFALADSLRSGRWPLTGYDVSEEDVTSLAWLQHSPPWCALCLPHLLLSLSLAHAVRWYTPLNHCRMTHLPLAYFYSLSFSFSLFVLFCGYLQLIC